MKGPHPPLLNLSIYLKGYEKLETKKKTLWGRMPGLGLVLQPLPQASVLSCEKLARPGDLYLVADWHEVEGRRLEETAIA